MYASGGLAWPLHGFIQLLLFVLSYFDFRHCFFISIVALVLWLLLHYLNIEIMSVICCAPPEEPINGNVSLSSASKDPTSATTHTSTPRQDGSSISGTVVLGPVELNVNSAAIAAAGFSAAAAVAKTMPSGAASAPGKLAGVAIISVSTVAAIAVSKALENANMKSNTASPSNADSFGTAPIASPNNAAASNASSSAFADSSALSQFYASSEPNVRWNATDWIQLPDNPVDLEIVIILCVMLFVFLSILCSVFLLLYTILLQETVSKRIIALFPQNWQPRITKWIATYLNTLKVLRWVYLGNLLFCLYYAFKALQHHLDWVLHLPK